MPIHKVQTPDGKIIQVEAPEGASEADVIAFAQANHKSETPAPEKGFLDKILSAVKSGKDDVVRGAGNMVAQIPQAVAWSPLGFGLGKERSQTLQNASEAGLKSVQKVLPVPENESTGRQYARAALESVGGGALLNPGGMVKAPILSTLANAAGGVGAKAGGDFGKTLDPEDSKLFETLLSLVGGAAAGGATSFAGSFAGGKTRLPQGQQRLHEATRGITPGQWNDVSRNVDAFNRVGANTATLADAFPKNSSIMGIAEEIRGSRGGEGFVQRTTGRKEDISRLADLALERAAPPQEGGLLANQTSNAAEGVRKNLDKLKNTGFGNRVRGETVDPRLLTTYLEEALKNKADAVGRDAPREAYLEIARALREQEGPRAGQLITDLPLLSQQLHGLGAKAKEGSLMNQGGANISANDLSIPLGWAKKRLGQIAPEFEGALADARDFNQNVRKPFSESSVNALADRNPSGNYPTPVSRLNKILDGNSPKEVERIGNTLGKDPGLSPSDRVDPAAIARVLMEQRLGNDKSNPGARIRGEQGSVDEARLSGLLKAGGKNPVEILEPLKVADSLQNFQGNPGHRGMDTPNVGGAIPQPRGYLRLLVNILGERAANKDIATILKDPANLTKLRQIAEFDPNVRRLLMATSLTAPQISQENQ